MATANIYFYGIPRKLARKFAKLIRGSVVETPSTFTWIYKYDENNSDMIYIEIEFYLDTPKKTRDLENEPPLLQDNDAGMRIYRAPNRPVYEPAYTVLVQHTPTLLQAYKVYRFCVNLTYAEYAEFSAQDEV